jgi:hypothetical protein
MSNLRKVFTIFSILKGFLYDAQIVNRDTPMKAVFFVMINVAKID